MVKFCDCFPLVTLPAKNIHFRQAKLGMLASAETNTALSDAGISVLPVHFKQATERFAAVLLSSAWLCSVLCRASGKSNGVTATAKRS